MALEKIHTLEQQQLIAKILATQLLIFASSTTVNSDVAISAFEMALKHLKTSGLKPAPEKQEKQSYPVNHVSWMAAQGYYPDGSPLPGE